MATGTYALEDVVVLDLSGAMGNYCGKLFADLGADVVLVEPLAGSELRHLPPFVDDDANLEHSLQFFYSNTNKRSVAIDLDQPDGQELLRRLASRADLLIEDAPPGRMADRGLAPDALIAANPRLVVTSITPFGQQGPYAHYQHADIVCLALGGLLWMGGYVNGPPVRAAGDQAYMAGNLLGAVASMVALTHAELRGEGQHADVSVQQSVIMGLENAAQYYDLEGHIRRRFGGEQRQAGAGVFPCADGYVFLLAGGFGKNAFWSNLVKWMTEEGFEDAARLDGEQWQDRDFVESEEAKEVFWEVFCRFAADQRKLDLYTNAQAWRVPLCPVNAPSDVLKSPQLEHRGFFHEVEAFGRSFAMPGAPYQLSETPWEVRSLAPRLGQHTDAVLLDAGCQEHEIDDLRKREVIR